MTPPTLDPALIKSIDDDVVAHIQAARVNTSYDAYVLLIHKSRDAILVRRGPTLIESLEKQGYVVAMDIGSLAEHINDEIKSMVAYHLDARIALVADDAGWSS